MKNETRVVADCREMPSDNNCSVTISGTEDEVMKIAVRHAVEDHGHKDSPELHSIIHSGLRKEAVQSH